MGSRPGFGRLLGRFNSYRGYVLVLDNGPRVTIGPGTYAKHRVRIGNVVEVAGVPVPDARAEWAELYRVTG